MPQAIPAAAASFANWAFASTGLAYGTAAHAIVTATLFYGAQAVLYTGVSIGLGAVAKAQVPDVETGKVTRKQPRPPRWYAVGGPSRMSGAYMLRESKGNKFGGVLALCEGRLASIDAIYLNDDLVTLSDGYVQGMANERYGTGDLVRLDYRLGLPTETHYGFLSADFAAEWPTTSRGDGVASLGWLAQHRSNESFPRHFPNGEIISSAVGTPVCYDWRDPAQDREDPSTWEPSWNPIVWTVFEEWARRGRDWDRCIAPVLADLTAEADYCDDVIDRGPVTEARYRCAGNYSSETRPDAVRANLLASMDGWLSVNGQGHLVVKAGRYVEPTFILTAEHIVGFSWQAFQPDEEACNALVVSYTSAEHDYTEVEAGTFTVEADISLRGYKPEPLPLPWVPSASQGMHLAKRKMSRLNAARRGSIRTGIYGLNGLGQRYIRVQNPMLASMADVVVEVMNVEIDFARSEVVFDVVLADTTLDDDETVAETPPPPVTRPSPSPGYQDPADPPIWKSEPFPIQIEAPGTLGIAAFTARRSDGAEVDLPADTILGMDDETTYGLFWREDAGYEVEAWPAAAHMATGSWLFLGWHTTPASDGTFPVLDAPPPGYSGSGSAPTDDYTLVRRPELGPLATADLPTSPSGLSAGDLYLDGATPRAVISEVSGTFAKVLASAAGAANVAVTVPGLPSGNYLDVTMYLEGGTLDADASLLGTLTFTEETSGGTTTHGPFPVEATSAGTDLGGGVYSVGSHTTVTFGKPAERSGDVTYRIAFARTGGSSFVAGATINGVVKITPTV